MSHIAMWLVIGICVLGLGVRWPLGVGGRGIIATRDNT